MSRPENPEVGVYRIAVPLALTVPFAVCETTETLVISLPDVWLRVITSLAEPDRTVALLAPITGDEMVGPAT